MKLLSSFLLFILLLNLNCFNLTIFAQEIERENQQSFVPIEEQHYSLLPDLSSTSVANSQSLKFYFWPGSASCYQLESALINWQKNHPEITIEKIPLVKRPQWRLLGKAWLVAVAMKKDKLFLSELYKTIHTLQQPIHTFKDLEYFITTLEIDIQEFTLRFNSLAINQQLKSLQKDAQLFPISGVPTIIINNRWYSDASMATTSAQIITIIELLLSEVTQTKSVLPNSPTP